MGASVVQRTAVIARDVHNSTNSHGMNRPPKLEGKASLCRFPISHNLIVPAGSALDGYLQCKVVYWCLIGVAILRSFFAYTGALPLIVRHA